MARVLRQGIVAAALIAPAHAHADITLDRGYRSTAAPVKGIVLHLHDCRGLKTSGWTDAWFKHFEQSGYRVYAPDSFAEKQRRRSCSWPYPVRESVYRLRQRQTEQALTVIRQKYADLPVYVWGHGEGAWLALRLKTRVAGIVTTGAICGHGRKGEVDTAGGVPVLALVGDPKLDRFLRRELRYKRARSAEAVCTKTFATASKRWQQFAGMGRIAPAWDVKVRAAVGTVIPIEESYTGVTPESDDANAWRLTIGTAARREFRRAYRNGGRQKAFAIGPFGYYGFSSTWGNAVDARVDALYRCNRVLQKNVTTGTPTCAVYAVNNSVRLRGPSRDTLRAVQAQLKELGYESGPVDGVWGRKTKAALNQLRAKHRLAPVDRYGKTSADLLDRLGAEAQ